MRYSSFNWGGRGKRGWIFGPLFGRLLTITIERRAAPQVQYNIQVRDTEDAFIRAQRRERDR